MIVTLALLLGSAVVIYLACEFFVNGVEWVGHRFGVSRTAVGTVLAAFGTALPESVVTLVAVVFGKTPGAKDIGVGAALGGPLALSTLAYAVVGAMFLLDRARHQKKIVQEFSTTDLAHDQAWFLVVFVFKVALGLVAFAWKPWLGWLFLAAYALYVWRELKGEGVEDDSCAGIEFEPLKLRPHAEHPGTAWAVLQTGASLAVIWVASQVFVHQLETVGPWLGMSPQLVALLLSPIATELPEILNAVIWVRQGKTALALGNISGAMMIQATVPSALGIFFTQWLLGAPLLWGAAITMAAIVVMLALLHRQALTAKRLFAMAALYGVFALGVALRFH
ncbi:sodium:calcium antiporter [Scleromatobacter humisilvae]|uniref:Sodium:calcium antiporter n=1 Tax=Scleromatobacter humisilvae TaxID=2897159 RepID=A0A9X2BZ56_9BURK|nr:sodium:calcium antiporter [Scleromatobacter humisilvae]MCK9686313.1 sodium:calcium antiporter [Scleromatobacter humisilvae]